jgi:glycosyltransferase involved in cell wall biosynthesis
MLRVSIIVPAFNEEKLLPATLASISQAAVSLRDRSWETELIVCDNNSTDRTAEVARQAGASVVFEPFNQIARARNTGARAATGQWLVFVDADSHPSAGLMTEVANLIESGRCLAGGSEVTFEGDRLLTRWGVHLWNWISRTFRWVAGSFIVCEAAAFREIGGFDEKYFVGEEIYLSRALKRLARRKKREIRIIRGHPLVTSTRKLHLYSPWEHLRFLAWTLLTFGWNSRRRAACAPWYDGRR